MKIQFEGEMFEYIKTYFQKQFSSSDQNIKFGYDSHKGVPEDEGWKLHIDNYCSNPDVYGIDKDDNIYLCQGKLIKENKSKLWELIGQAISNRNYCHYVYIFFNQYFYSKLKDDEPIFQDFNDILKYFKIGLLVVNDDFKVERIIDAKEQNIKENIESVLEKVKEAIISEGIVKGFRKELREVIIKTGINQKKEIKIYWDNKACYISLDEWQEIKKIYYFIKVISKEPKEISIGINIHTSLAKKDIVDKIRNLYKFPKYNRKDISEFNENEIKGGTHELHNSIQNDYRDFKELSSNSKKKEEIKKMLIDVILLHPKLKSLLERL